MRKPTFCMPGDHSDDQGLWFCYIDNAIPLAIFYGGIAKFVSDLDGNHKDSFLCCITNCMIPKKLYNGFSVNSETMNMS